MARRLLFFWCKVLCVVLWLLAVVHVKQPEEGLSGPILVLGLPLSAGLILGTPLAFGMERVRARVLALDSWAAGLLCSLIILGLVWDPESSGAFFYLGIFAVGLGCAVTGLELAAARKGRPPSGALFIGTSLGFIGGATEIVQLTGGQEFCFVCWLTHFGIVAVAILLERWRVSEWGSLPAAETAPPESP